jgi:hypothetical protein
MTFIEGIIGVPAVATINWDDPYIHSSDDDLFQIDQTQLHRNAFLMGATAYALAFMDETKVPLLAEETFAQGERRLANDLQKALRSLTESQKENGYGWKDANLLLEQGVQREVRALSSINIFAAGNKSAAQTVEYFVGRMKARESELISDVASYYRLLHSVAPSFAPADSLEMVASRKTPANVTSVKTYFENRGKVDFRGNLHSLMRDEVYNFVDGKRSYYDIFKAARAEQLAGDTWYYGTVSLQDVMGLLDAAVAAKALTLK